MLFKIFSQSVIIGLAFFSLGLPRVQAAEANALPIGGLAIKQETLVHLIKTFAIDSLKKTLKPIPTHADPDADPDQFEVSLPEFANTIPLPVASGTAVGQILDILSIKGPVGIKLDPTTVKMRLPDSAFSVKVDPPTAKNPNTFKVVASWKITDLSAHTENFSVNIPQGLFSESFSLIASPIDFSVKKGHSLDFSVSFYATLAASGTKIHLADFRSNLIESTDADVLDLNIGPIRQVTAEKTVAGKDLNLSIENKKEGFGVEANEKDIQTYFMSFEPQLLDNLKKTLVPMISENIQKAAKEFQDQKPLHYPYNSNTILSTLKLQNPEVQKLLSDIQLDFSLSAIKSMGLGKNIFAAEVSTELCLDGKCVESAVTPSIPQDRDLVSIVQTKNGIGVGIYQSLLKDILHSPAVQARIETYFASVVKDVINSSGKYEKYITKAGDGIHLGKKAVFIDFDPTTQEIILVVNFDIQPSQLGIADKIKLGIVDSIFSSMDDLHLYLPFELKSKIGAIEKDQNGNFSFPLLFTPPIEANGNMADITICDENDCPNSISNAKTDATIAKISSYLVNARLKKFSNEELKGLVQRFNKSIRSKLMSFLPKGKFDVQIPSNLGYQGIDFVPKSVEITPDHQLLFVGQIQNEEQKNAK